MKNAFLWKMETTVTLRVEGKNIERFLHRLYNNQISILKIRNQTYKTVEICVWEKDLEKIMEKKTIYEISIVSYTGKKHFLFWLKKNRWLFFFLLLGYVALLLLTNTIFEVEVIHNDVELRNLLYQELAEKGITPRKFMKSYEQLEKIKKEILAKEKDKIEWLEIERVGTKYIVRVEERILNKDENDTSLQEIIATKSAVIKKVVAKSGEIVKNVNDYVKAGDVVISGNLKIYDEVKSQVRAEGTVYGEVWYKVQVEYPLHYYEEKKTGKKNTVYTLKFLNRRFELFNFHSFKDKSIKSKTIWKDILLPITLQKEKQEELIVTDETYTKETAIKKAKEEAKKKIESNLKDEEHVIDVKELQVDANDSRIIIDLFVTVYENITGSKPLEPIPEQVES